ncbi:MAG: alternate F1F0 ATPase, F1 subunit alpha [Armatimonadetes bacterium]|nr:alternate F1F0 ATPase, F1 subunit alpha [Armatimonadota bacterium]
MVIESTDDVIGEVVERSRPELESLEIGIVTQVGQGVARVDGLPSVESEELVRFPGRRMGMAFNLDPDEVGVILLDDSEQIRAGDEVRRTGRLLDVPVGESLLGRVIDPLGRPRDGGRPLQALEHRLVEREAPPIMHRAPVSVPLQTGIKAIDALIPVGRGQRELILGDRQTGKSAIALDTIINQKDTGVLCIYCAIGQRTAAVARFVADLQARGGMGYCLVVMASGEDPPGLQYVAPYAATTMGEYFMETGRDVLVIYDDLTRHSRAYRELSLLLRRPPGREAFPGDIFYIHSRLLERSTRLRPEYGGGSLTALPIVETEAQNVAAYIPTNLISITDGQIYLSPDLFQKGFLPAVDVGTSVSRVGGKAQLAAFKDISGELRLSYSQFEELETFARFGTRLDEDTRRTLERGRRVREALKQPQYAPVPVEEQIAVLVCVTRGVLDGIPLDGIADAEQAIRRAVVTQLPELCKRIRRGDRLTDQDTASIVSAARQVLEKQPRDDE